METKKYSDSREGALKLLCDMSDMEGLDAFDDPQFTIDPSCKGVWLVAIPSRERACIVYTHECDFEDVDFEEAMERYFPNHGR